MGFPGSSAGKESACNAGHPNSIPGSGRSPGVPKRGEGDSGTIRNSCENSTESQLQDKE